ncbi:MAG: hypothetical protein ABRQ38_07120 [Candidatus Eremiobacterota bacterium]|mgnify:CR=1 FL=1
MFSDADNSNPGIINFTGKWGKEIKETLIYMWQILRIAGFRSFVWNSQIFNKFLWW